MFLKEEERPAGEPAKVRVGTMKLSAAIRIGALIRPKCTGTFFAGGGSCAMGAAMEAYGLPYEPNSYLAAERALPFFPELFKSVQNFTELADKIYRRNDSPNATREEVADWLESQGY